MAAAAKIIALFLDDFDEEMDTNFSVWSDRGRESYWVSYDDDGNWYRTDHQSYCGRKKVDDTTRDMLENLLDNYNANLALLD
jgi:hypothetical protein